MGTTYIKYSTKGGVVLGITAVAHASGVSHWNSLAPALRDPASHLIASLDDSDNVLALARAVKHNIQGTVSVSLPAWVERLVRDQTLLAFIGDTVSHHWPPDTDTPAPSGLAGGKTALAIAFCRNPDTARALTTLVDTTNPDDIAPPTALDGLTFWDIIALAGVCAPPGLPSQLRKQLKAFVQEAQGASWDE